MHNKNLRDWISKTNPFSQKMYHYEETFLVPVACSEYNAELQKDILHLNGLRLIEPIPDIGCGKDGNFIGYAKKYMDILRSLKIGGYFCYAPDLPFIEGYVDEEKFLIKKYDIENLLFKTTIIKRLN